MTISNLKLGRRPPSRKPALQFGALWTGVMPPHPANVDYLAKLTNWQMLGNDQYGDCVAVTAANVRRLVTGVLGTPYYPQLDEVIAFYKTQNPNFPNDDNGMDIQTALGWWNKNKWGGTQLVAFAQVDHTNLEEMKAAAAIFGSVWLGVNVEAINMSQFDAGKPWDYAARSPIEGGHSVISGGYLGKASADLTFITWGKETAFTDNFIKHLCEEAWVVIQPENLGTVQFQQGIDMTALSVAYEQITGRPLPVPTPVPTPTPTPSKVWSVTKQTPTHIEMDLK